MGSLRGYNEYAHVYAFLYVYIYISMHTYIYTHTNCKILPVNNYSSFHFVFHYPNYTPIYYSSFHFIFHYPYIIPIYYSSFRLSLGPFGLQELTSKDQAEAQQKRSRLAVKWGYMGIIGE